MSMSAGQTITTALDEAITAVEGLLRRPKEQSLFDSQDLLAVLDRVDLALLGATTAVGSDVSELGDISAAARRKASGQPAVDAPATKGGVLLDLWTGLSELRSTTS